MGVCVWQPAIRSGEGHNFSRNGIYRFPILDCFTNNAVYVAKYRTTSNAGYALYRIAVIKQLFIWSLNWSDVRNERMLCWPCKFDTYKWVFLNTTKKCGEIFSIFWNGCEQLPSIMYIAWHSKATCTVKDLFVHVIGVLCQTRENFTFTKASSSIGEKALLSLRNTKNHLKFAATLFRRET